MTALPAHNLMSRTASVKKQYPGITVYWLGDANHQAEQSDHNPDSRGLVHAIDCMTYTDTARGNEIVRWVLTDTDDVEYIIFNRTIWSRSNSFKPKAYTGDNPHVEHVHISGKHGNVGANAATGTGYDVVAEQMTPEGFNMATLDAADIAAIRTITTSSPWQYTGNGMPGVPAGWSTLKVLGSIYSVVTLLAEKSNDVTAEELAAIKAAAEAGAMAAVDDIVNAVIAAIPDNAVLSKADVEAAVRAVFLDAGTEGN